ncbi:MAG: 5-methyltetrahydropteroyltriglutamate--homocysteine S-methyltransferase [Chloroflexota bacterium]|nr:5-methyltetrahydropteroyltriglutamate--homocysteine S-methyltransferase [Chloroflexota bacterium]MDE2885865.1 5-methyltetrahydropteroyltriglutamate--homocysteine S-methyltransferase [Chloroflexota bacterium]
MATSTNLGFPRIGANRELKWAVEAYWAGKIDAEELQQRAALVRRSHWDLQRKAGITHIPSNDFSLYDHVLDTSVMVGAVPERYDAPEGPVSLDTYFAMARGRSASDDAPGVPAMEMTKWFDTNYHYIVPEINRNQVFSLRSTKPVDEFLEAQALGIQTRPVLVGPVTYLLLSKSDDHSFDPLLLLEGLVDVYENILKRLADAGAEWVQMDEPALSLTLTDKQRSAFGRAYARLSSALPGLNILVAVYFGDLRQNTKAALALPVQGLHIDLVRGRADLENILAKLGEGVSLSLGLVDGRNIWKTDLEETIATARRAASVLGHDRIFIAPSCSLLHSPVDLDNEKNLDEEMKSWMAFAKQKVREVATITHVLNGGSARVAGKLAANAAAMASRRTSTRIHNPVVKERSASVTPEMSRRTSAYPERRKAQQQVLRLPSYPTTTIGSFPQTPEIRKARASRNRGELTTAEYEQFIRQEIENSVRFQEETGLDVLVHGEPERNDMVEYFGEQLDGYVSTSNGWVQSYGSRAVKPPIIYGDLHRPAPMTVDWIAYAQSLTRQPVKGMLTGPVTMLQWSFVRDDQPRSETCRQLALVIRDEVGDLERAGIRVIQVDEPALREGLPLRREDWDAYLEWAVECFRIATSGVEDRTQMHTHMCYAAYDDIIDSVAAMDADVISMENSRSDGTLLDTFRTHPYPNEIGPGVYDIHSPRVAETDEMSSLLRRAVDVIPSERLWVNPDCGLKTRRWDEVKPSLRHMVEAARELRGQS